MFTKTTKDKTDMSTPTKKMTIEQYFETEKKPVQTKSPLQIVEQEIQSEIEYVKLKGKELRAYKRLIPVSEWEEKAAQIRPFLPACYKTLAEFCGRRTQPLTAAELQEVRKNADKIAKAIFWRRGKYMITDKDRHLKLDYFLFCRMYLIEDNRYRLAQRYAEKQKEVLLRHQEVKETLRLIEEGPLTQQNRQKIKNLITNLTQIIMQGDIAAGYIKRTVPKNMEEEEEKHFLQCKQNTVNQITQQKIEDYKEGKLDASYETMRQALNLPMRVIDKEHPEIYREWLTEAFKKYIQYLGEKEYEETRVQKEERYHTADTCLCLLSKEEECTEQDKKQIHALICDIHSELTLHDVKWAYIPKEVPECQKEEEQKRFLEYRKNIFSKWVLKEVEKRKPYLPMTDMAKILKLPFREEDIKKYGDACDMVADYLYIMNVVQQRNKKTEEYKKSYLESIEYAKGQINDLYRKYFKLKGITREQDLEEKMKRVNEESEKMFLKYREMADEEVEPAPKNWRDDPTLVSEELFVLGWR